MNGQNILCQNGCSKQQLCEVKFVSYNYFIQNCFYDSLLAAEDISIDKI